jgi:hypothetical protein
MTPLPRAAPSSVVTLDGDLYNFIAQTLERLDKWTVQPPLNLQQTPAGNLLSVAPPPGEMVLVQITGIETGSGYYKGCILKGASSNTNAYGSGTDIFQIDQSTAQSDVDGPEPSFDSGGHLIEDALICNIQEQYNRSSHILNNVSNVHSMYMIGRVMGTTNETPPRKRVYVGDWPLRPVICQITTDFNSGSLPEGGKGGVYVGKTVEGQFVNSNNAFVFPLASEAAGNIAAQENCWIINNWEQTYVFPQRSIADTQLPVGTFVWGLMAGFPVYGWSGGSTTVDVFYLVYTWTPIQAIALQPQVSNVATGGTAGTTYGSTEQGMINNLKIDVTRLHDSLKQLYRNLQFAGYSK